MNTTKTYCCFDVETSGISKQTDRILQLSAYKLNENLDVMKKFTAYIKPSGPYVIDEAAEVVHGLTKEFIEEHGRPLKQVGREFIEFVGDSDYITYNGNNFDVIMAVLDFAREGLQFPFEGKKFYDVMSIERKLNPRNLDSVYKKYTGHSMEEDGLLAHDAGADCIATFIILKHQMENYGLTMNELGEWEENNLLTPEGSIVNKANAGMPPILVFAFGKYKDKEIYNVMKTDPDYCRWWSQNIASQYTRQRVREYVKNCMENEKISKS